MALTDFEVVEALESPTGILMAVGAVVLAPVALPAIGRIVRPVTKMAIRGYMATADYVSGVAAEVRERGSDLVAEVEAERKGRPKGRVAKAT